MFHSTPKKQAVPLTWNRTCILFFLCLYLAVPTSWAQEADSISLVENRQKKTTRNIAIASGVVYGASLYGLNKTWYEEFPRTEFHFFNDNNQWKQLDKVGHFYSAFHISQASIHLFQKAGMAKKKAHIWGGMMGFLILTPIEILDGFSQEYGASWGDLIANGIGAGTAMIQHMVWDDLRIKPKFSFAPSSYADERPNVLGDGFHEELIKDYNGQTYWLSFDTFSFLRDGTRFPKWLNIAVGYGVNNMVYANSAENQAAGFDAYRQYYIGIDFDLSHFSSKSKFVNTVIYMVDLIHLPAPTLEYNRSQGLKFHFLKF